MITAKELIERAIQNDPNNKDTFTKYIIETNIHKTCNKCPKLFGCTHNYPQWETCEQFKLITVGD